MKQPPCIIVEKIDSPILMPGSGKSPISGLVYISLGSSSENSLICTRSILIPKLPFVSNSRILAPSARLSHTFILPSKDVAARYCPSSERTRAHISPALLPSAHLSAFQSLPSRVIHREEIAPTILPFSLQWPLPSTDQILISPPKPTLAAACPFLLVAR